MLKLRVCLSVLKPGQFITQDSSAQCIVGSPPYLLNPQIIGAEDDYFDSQQEQVSKTCFWATEQRGRDDWMSHYLHLNEHLNMKRCRGPFILVSCWLFSLSLFLCLSVRLTESAAPFRPLSCWSLGRLTSRSSSITSSRSLTLHLWYIRDNVQRAVHYCKKKREKPTQGLYYYTAT